MNQLLDDIFLKSTNVDDGFLRIGIIGFHSEIVIGMNLFVTSFIDGRSRAAELAKKALHDLTMFAESNLNFKTTSFQEIFEQLPSLFDARGHKTRELLIITNASPGLYNRQWGSKLQQLEATRTSRYSNINIRAVAVNKPCDVRSHTRYQEDCSYTSALETIDLQFSGSFIMQGAAISAATDVGIGKRATLWRGFYNQMIVDVNRTIKDIIEHMKCEVPENPQPDCVCTARAELCASTKCFPPSPTGPPGPKGPPGAPGYYGPPGSCGTAGPKGNKGLDGPDGQKGGDGPDGSIGGPGRPGHPGREGNDGRAGDKGKQGPKGNPGTRGPSGNRGGPGDPGSDGDRGMQGRQGPDGGQGTCGNAGPKGRKGVNGADKTNELHDLDALMDASFALLDKVLERPDVAQRLQQNARKFVITTGKCPCAGSNCRCGKQPETTPPPTTTTTLPPFQPPAANCISCRPHGNSIIFSDNSESMLTGNKLKESSSVMGDWAQQIVESFEGQCEEGEQCELLVARFSGRLQMEARVTSANDKLVYHDYSSEVNRERYWWNHTSDSTITANNVRNRVKTQLFSKSPHRRENTWGWNGQEYNYQVRNNSEAVPNKRNMGIQTSYFYTALWDLYNYLELYPFTGPKKSTMIFLTDSEYYDDTPDEWEKEDNEEWAKRSTELRRRHRANGKSPRKDELRQEPDDVCKLLKNLNKYVGKMIFVHSPESGTVKRQGGHNKSQFIMQRLFNKHLHEDCPGGTDYQYDLVFPEIDFSLKELEVKISEFFFRNPGFLYSNI